MIAKDDFDQTTIISILANIIPASLYFGLQLNALQRMEAMTGEQSDVGGLLVIMYGFQAVIIGGVLGGLVGKTKMSVAVPQVFYMIALMFNFELDTGDSFFMTLALTILLVLMLIVLGLNVVSILIADLFAQKTFRRPNPVQYQPL
ncbi:MAG: hypothetical protein INQ03_10020 [Candidatus Heimdallarchaeota archaeon]|nr:hypothetical protein [Candidatus Heimdallarchaeota archaeon]